MITLSPSVSPCRSGDTHPLLSLCSVTRRGVYLSIGVTPNFSFSTGRVFPEHLTASGNYSTLATHNHVNNDLIHAFDDMQMLQCYASANCLNIQMKVNTMLMLNNNNK
jgi:hypothetical protein